MTEQEWLTSDDPAAMLAYLNQHQGAPYNPPAKATQAALLRCIVGNPFRPVRFAADTLSGHPDGTYEGLGPLPQLLDPRWLVWDYGAIPKMAQAIYDGRTWDQLPILADALEDAGADDAQILGHLRGPGPHARGCHVLDLLLGKS